MFVSGVSVFEPTSKTLYWKTLTWLKTNQSKEKQCFIVNKMIEQWLQPCQLEKSCLSVVSVFSTFTFLPNSKTLTALTHDYMIGVSDVSGVSVFDLAPPTPYLGLLAKNYFSLYLFSSFYSNHKPGQYLELFSFSSKNFHFSIEGQQKRSLSEQREQEFLDGR